MEKHISNLIDKMDHPARIIFVSYYYNQMSVDEITQEIGLSSDTIMRLLFDSSNEVIKTIGNGGIYYVALMTFLALSNEATTVRI